MMDIRIDTEDVFSKFNEHFTPPTNERILFSSAFGTGKSTFITEYFDRHTEFNIFKIYPVSYAIAGNDDVFELIKYDILFQLLGRAENSEISLINEDYSQILAYQFKFLKQIKLTPILFKIIEYADKTGTTKVIKSVIDNIKKQYCDFKLEGTNEEENIFNFLNEQYSKDGSPRENDLITQLIKTLLQRLLKENSEGLEDEDSKENSEGSEKKEKKNVLIIDDLDRLDPEHIFRLFNVFSVNFGKEGIHNKFCFDKIIFICDFDNIRKIYEHRYGKGVDFEGYIDKFYSIIPFKFDTNQYLNNYILELIRGFNLPVTFIDFSEIRNIEDQTNFVLLKTVLKTLIVSNKINLRTLINIKIPIVEDDGVVVFSPQNKFIANEFPILKLFKILEIIFDSKEIVLDVLNDLSKSFNPLSFVNRSKMGRNVDEKEFYIVIEMCLPFIVDHNKFFQVSNDSNFDHGKVINLKISNHDKLIHFTVITNYSTGIKNDYYFRKFSEVNDPEKIVEVNPFLILLLAFQKAREFEMF